MALPAEYESMSDTRGSGIVSSADDLLEMSMVRGVRGLVECVKCVCIWLGVGWKLRRVSG